MADFERVLRQAIAAKQLEIPDPARAAQHFFCLLSGMDHLKLQCGRALLIPNEEAATQIGSVVEMFLRAYAPR